MTTHERALTLPEASDLIDVGELVAAYHEREPAEPVSFDTSGHRGTSLDGSFTEAHGVTRRDYVSGYVDDMPAVIDIDAIREAGLRLGIDPLGGDSLPYWQAIKERHGLDLIIVNDELRPDVPLRPARLGRQDPHGLRCAATARPGAPTRTG
jgi:phosphoglucomutase